MSLEEAIFDSVRRLLPAQQERVLRFLDGLRNRVSVKMVPSRGRASKMKWIADRGAYRNQCVVVEGDRSIAADPDGHKTFAAAKAAAIEVRFLVHVLPEDPLPFIPGW
jgi:hypothetical protein